MDKTVLRNFAIESRKDLMEKIDRKIKLFYIDEEFKKENRGDVIVLSNDKHSLTLTKDEDSNRDKLLKRIVELGYDQVVEEAAYTWFNRIIAIRYMELHDFLPLTRDNQSLGIRVLSSKENIPDPEILRYTVLTSNELDINFNREKYNNMSSTDEKFKYVLKLICDKLGKVIPQVFDGVTDYIDLVIPDNMLSNGGFISNLILNVDISNFNEVEILGWLYQYYNQIEKDRVITSKKVYKKNEIPYATELFTPNWLVKYMVENTLGKYYFENYDCDDFDDFEYIIKKSLVKTNEIKDPKEIKFIDPCCGSGHILVSAFDVFVKMYLNYGYNTKEIPELILKHNIYGLDVDDRAGQLSILSIILKAREYDKNIFNKSIIQNLNIMSIQESNTISTGTLETIDLEDQKEFVEDLIVKYKNAKELGSLIFPLTGNYEKVESIITSNDTIFGYELKEKLLPIIKCSKILSQKYDIVITNPPYMGNTYMPKNIKEFVNKNYKIGNSDLFAAFIIKTLNLSKESGYIGLVTPYVWLYIKSYEDLRKFIIQTVDIESLVQLEYNAFEAAVVPVCSFVLRNRLTNRPGTYIRLSDFRGADNQPIKYLEAINDEHCKYIYYRNSSDFSKIPGTSIAYWVDDKTLGSFSNKTFEEYVETKVGLSTGNNNLFLRNWYEVNVSNINLNNEKDDYKWVPLIKGGDYKKWYGNRTEVVYWENDGKRIKEYDGSTIRNESYYFKETVACSAITSSTNTFRYYPSGSIIDVNFRAMYIKNHEIDLYYLIALLNSKIVNYYCKLLSPTMALNIYDINRIPLLYDDSKMDILKKYSKECIELCKSNWDRYETSWDFKRIDFLSKGLIKENIAKCLEIIKNNKNKLKEYEEEINQLFIEIYGLNDVLSKSIDEELLTIQESNEKDLVKELISYSVGCMFGRYSLNKDGLVLAGNNYDKSKYSIYIPDDDNIIPISDNDSIYYNDDIVGKFKEFIKTTFGEQTLNANLNYIAEVLGKKGTESSEDTIRRYFVNDFFNEHVKTYQKRPIYWLFDSGKKNGFKCLIYLHRYDEQLVSKIRTKYLHNTLSIYQRTVEEIDYKLNNEELSTTDKRELQNKKSDLNGKITECNEYEEMVGNVANKMIKLDLDDGVAINYAKFVDDNGKSILAKIK